MTHIRRMVSDIPWVVFCVALAYALAPIIDAVTGVYIGESL